MPVTLPPGRPRLATRPNLTGSLPLLKTMGIVVVAIFAASAAGVLPGVAMTVTRRQNQIGYQCRQAIVLILCPAIFDRYVPALDIAGFTQGLAKCGHEVRPLGGRSSIEESNYRRGRIHRR